MEHHKPDHLQAGGRFHQFPLPEGEESSNSLIGHATVQSSRFRVAAVQPQRAAHRHLQLQAVNAGELAARADQHEIAESERTRQKCLPGERPGVREAPTILRRAQHRGDKVSEDIPTTVPGARLRIPLADRQQRSRTKVRAEPGEPSRRLSLRDGIRNGFQQRVESRGGQQTRD